MLNAHTLFILLPSLWNGRACQLLTVCVNEAFVVMLTAALKVPVRVSVIHGFARFTPSDPSAVHYIDSRLVSIASPSLPIAVLQTYDIFTNHCSTFRDCIYKATQNV